MSTSSIKHNVVIDTPEAATRLCDALEKAEKMSRQLEYKLYTDITRTVLDSVEAGDLVKVNDWVKPMRVMGVSENYFVMAQKQFKDTVYSVCEKTTLEPQGYYYNGMRGGRFHCSTDNMIFGYLPREGSVFDGKQYEFDNPDWVKEYLQAFEAKYVELSQRHGMVIDKIAIKKRKT